MEWDARRELIANVLASIQPVRTDKALSIVLAEDFPRDCSNLPISGGWGYTRAEAISFVRNRFPVPEAADLVSLEHHIVQKIIYEELIIFRPKDYKFSGITTTYKRQRLLDDGRQRFDCLEFSVSCWSDWHWDQLKREWEANDFGDRPGFDVEAHAARREASRLQYEREFWFDISDVFGRFVAVPGTSSVSQSVKE
jgi:hypothetical protein